MPAEAAWGRLLETKTEDGSLKKRVGAQRPVVLNVAMIGPGNHTKLLWFPGSVLFSTMLRAPR